MNDPLTTKGHVCVMCQATAAAGEVNTGQRISELTAEVIRLRRIVGRDRLEETAAAFMGNPYAELDAARERIKELEETVQRLNNKIARRTR